MKILTRDFGEIEIDENDIITFEGEIFGFSDYKKFVFLFQEDISEHFVWLQSVEQPEICFILVDPGLVMEDYNPVLPEDIKALLGEGDYMHWLIVVVKEVFDESTVNLKSPIYVNPQTKKAAQIILDQDYPIRYPLLQKKGAV